MRFSRTMLAACLALTVLGVSAYYLSSYGEHRSESAESPNVGAPSASAEPKGASTIASHSTPSSQVDHVGEAKPTSAGSTPATPPPTGVVVTDLKNLPKSDVDPVKELSARYTKRDLDLIARLTARSLPVDQQVTSIITARNQGATQADLEAMIATAYPGLSNLPVRDEMVRWAQPPADVSATTGASPSTNPPAAAPSLMNKPVERTKKPEEFK